MFLDPGLLTDCGAAVHDGEGADYRARPHRDRTEGADRVGGHEDREAADLHPGGSLTSYFAEVGTGFAFYATRLAWPVTGWVRWQAQPE